MTPANIYVDQTYAEAEGPSHRTVTDIEGERVFYREAGTDGVKETTLAAFATWAGEQQARMFAVAQANGPDSPEAAAERDRVLAASTQHASPPIAPEHQIAGEPA